ncbi:protein kinase superfamily protein [Actinidia rufa]|uniref:Protein kinase superfamily protein n=1 Tax=Actinidia rufa TaxID=165716 RepID=A0A7J0H9L9_9ERIC|nr:protein kinase superfamily protein [Actinidia rufa]
MWYIHVQHLDIVDNFPQNLNVAFQDEESLSYELKHMMLCSLYLLLSGFYCLSSMSDSLGYMPARNYLSSVGTVVLGFLVLLINKGDTVDTETGSQEEDFLLQDEIYKSRLASIKREEDTFMRERDRYELEKGRLIREMKRIRDEDGSRFNNFQILNYRYALLNLLGKGGFSEVYKAFDLVEHRFVACKLHGLNAQWSEDKKQSYIRHAIREYNIHKTLVHHHIVRLWDIFEIDQNTFCTMLEYCSGKDLDAVLKATPVLPEREARIIIIQIFQGLVYLNKRNTKIIHYDLKPGNVLFDDFGVAKVTDFGLSKIVEDDVGSQGMELTSQGAGTYWLVLHFFS